MRRSEMVEIIFKRLKDFEKEIKDNKELSDIVIKVHASLILTKLELEGMLPPITNLQGFNNISDNAWDSE